MRGDSKNIFHPVSVHGWVRLEECGEDQPGRLLGKLGGHFAHDTTKALGGGRPHGVPSRGDSRTPCLESASRAAAAFDGTDGFEVPSWSALAAGLRPLPRNPEDHEPGCPRQGWQHEAASRVERQFRSAVLFPSLCDSDRALMRSQSGPGAGVALSATPSSALTRIESALFRVLLLRRLRQPLPLTKRLCSCDRLLDFRGHHRITFARPGILSRRGFALESAAARVCRETGARVATNVIVRDMDLNVPNARDERRLEVVADGLPLFGGAQLAVDTTLVSALRGDGSARSGAGRSRLDQSTKTQRKDLP